MALDEDCPICTASTSAKERFASAKVAEHIKEKARHDERHRAWIDDYTENGTMRGIRAALRCEHESSMMNEST